jgi:proline dehydrogenase
MLPPVARRFVAGEEAATALEHARQLNDRSVGALLNLLGEHHADRGPADADAAAYRRLVEDIAGADLRARLSVKPTQLGLAADEAVFRENLGTVVEHADDHDVFVWVDMESPDRSRRRCRPTRRVSSSCSGPTTGSPSAATTRRCSRARRRYTRPTGLPTRCRC